MVCCALLWEKIVPAKFRKSSSTPELSDHDNLQKKLDIANLKVEEFEKNGL